MFLRSHFDVEIGNLDVFDVKLCNVVWVKLLGPVNWVFYLLVLNIWGWKYSYKYLTSAKGKTKMLSIVLVNIIVSTIGQYIQIQSSQSSPNEGNQYFS